jgi:acyl carrier protein
MTSSTGKKVKEIVAKVANKPEDEISEESKLVDLQIKSVNRIELAALLEDEFDIKISNADILRVVSVADLISLVSKQMS